MRYIIYMMPSKDTTKPDANINSSQAHDASALLVKIKQHAIQLGFADVGVSSIDLSEAEVQLLDWLDKGFHGQMHYMQKHGLRRTQPAQLIPGTVSILSLRMNYLTQPQQTAIDALELPNQAYISRYALGRDYHKLMRQRLAKLAKFIETLVGPFGHRVFTDSAPVLEKPIAAQAGLGWVGKHSNILCREQGSWFFLGEIYLDFDLSPPPDKELKQPTSAHCGECTSCIDVCPTQAIVTPYVVDARRCISYLTIEHHGSIPEELRIPMGNRIYGCDDCQLFCPWNRFAPQTEEADFAPRNNLDTASLLSLFAWSETQFLNRLEGSAIRRIGHVSWLRNIAIAIGNAPYNEANVIALRKRLDYPNEIVQEHVIWALEQQSLKSAAGLGAEQQT